MYVYVYVYLWLSLYFSWGLLSWIHSIWDENPRAFATEIMQTHLNAEGLLITISNHWYRVASYYPQPLHCLRKSVLLHYRICDVLGRVPWLWRTSQSWQWIASCGYDPIADTRHRPKCINLPATLKINSGKVKLVVFHLTDCVVIHKTMLSWPTCKKGQWQVQGFIMPFPFIHLWSNGRFAISITRASVRNMIWWYCTK